MLQSLNSFPAGGLQSGARVAVTGDNVQMTQGAVHTLDGQPKRTSRFSLGAPTLSLGLPSTCPQPWSASSTSRQRWAPPQAVGWVVATLDFVLIFVLSLLLIVNSSSNARLIAQYYFVSIGIAGLFIAFFGQRGGYKNEYLHRLTWQTKNLVASWIFITGGSFCLTFATPTTTQLFTGKFLVIWLTGAPLFLTVSRIIYNHLYSYLIRAGYVVRNIIILGAGNHVEWLIRKIQSTEAEGLHIRGVFDDRKSRIPAAIGGVPVLGTSDDLIDFVRREMIDEVLIAFPLADGGRIASLSRKLEALAIDVRLSIEPLPGSFRARTVNYLGDTRVLDLVERPLKGWPGILKILQDRVLSLILLICTGPLMLVIAILIKLDSRGPVFFVQERFGLNNSVIRVLKFRTMHLSCGDPTGQKRTVKNDPRVTRAGRILRRYSLDELPQLLNVIRGDMSLVGPRPHAVAMMAGDQFYYDAVEEYSRRHRVKPGITGWAQVNGSRGEIDTLAKARDRVRLDLHYIEHWSLWLDLKILFKTVSLLLCKSAY
jgi:Undecaprenyl-phosphate glucose phosphotransferase